MSFDMLPDSAIEYLIKHHKCPRDHRMCLIDQKENDAVKLHETDIISDSAYKPNWMVYLQAPDSECPVYKLMIVSETENSYNPDKRIRVRHEFMVPPADYTLDVWLAWVFDRYRDVEAHESGEFFMYKGVRVFAPHHGNGQDPYRIWFVSDYAHTRTRAGDDDE